MIISSISFTYPLALLLLLLAPLIWKFSKTKSLSFEIRKFPAIKLIKKKKSLDNTFENNSILIIILRFLIFILIIFAISKPAYKSRLIDSVESKKILLILDDSWIASIGWENKITKVKKILNSIALQNISYSLITSSKIDQVNFRFQENKSESEVIDYVNSIKPNSWESSYKELFLTLKEDINEYNNIYWFTEPIMTSSKKEFLEKIKGERLKIIKSSKEEIPPIIYLRSISQNNIYNFEIFDLNKAYDYIQVDCYDIKERLILRKQVQTKSNKKNEFNANYFKLEIPAEFDQSITYFHFNNIQSPTAKIIKKNKTKIKKIGIIQSNYQENSSSYNRANYYVNKALQNNHDVVTGNVDDLIGKKASLLISDDLDNSFFKKGKEIVSWIENGGTFVKFGGANMLDLLEKNETTEILETIKISKIPVDLNHEMSFKNELRIKSFAEDSIFNDLKISKDIAVRKYLEIDNQQNLTQINHIAYLENGAPLISMRNVGEGKLIFFHIPANTNWSNLPFSVLFLDILEKLNLYSMGSIEDRTLQVYKPLKILDGLGKFNEPSLNTMNLNDNNKSELSFKNPPGIYKNNMGIFGLNISDKLDIENFSTNFTKEYDIIEFENIQKQSLGKNLIIFILILFFIETIIMFYNRNIFRINIVKIFSSFFFIFFILNITKMSDLLANSKFKNIDGTRLAYVRTNNEQVDEISKKGIKSISNFITSKTSVIMNDPIEINLEQDDFFFYPLIYFPFNNSSNLFKDDTIQKMQLYINHGGILVFDCKASSESYFIEDCVEIIQRRLVKLDISLPRKLFKEDTLSKSFYLLNEYPGRQNQDVYIASNNQIVNDEVISLVIGNNDWAGAWAKVGENFQLPMLNGGISQRNLSFRFGVNLVLYSLTGNYKADQVHIPEILKRMQ